MRRAGLDVSLTVSVERLKLKHIKLVKKEGINSDHSATMEKFMGEGIA